MAEDTAGREPLTEEELAVYRAAAALDSSGIANGIIATIDALQRDIAAFQEREDEGTDRVREAEASHRDLAQDCAALKAQRDKLLEACKAAEFILSRMIPSAVICGVLRKAIAEAEGAEG